MLGLGTQESVEAFAQRCEAAISIAELNAIIETTLLSTQIRSFAYLHSGSASNKAVELRHVRMYFGTSSSDLERYLSQDFFNAKSVWRQTADVVVPVKGEGHMSAYFVIRFYDPDMHLTLEDRRTLQNVFRRIHSAYFELSQTEQNSDATLTLREIEVLRWTALGKSNAVIARILTLTPQVIDSSMTVIYRKLNVSDRARAGLRAIELGLI